MMSFSDADEVMSVLQITATSSLLTESAIIIWPVSAELAARMRTATQGQFFRLLNLNLY